MAGSFLSEDDVEQTLLAQLGELGYARAEEEQIGPDGTHPERGSHAEVVLQGRLREAMARLNPGLPEEAREEALRLVLRDATPSLAEENRRLHHLMVHGVRQEYRDEDGATRGRRVRLLDLEDPAGNDWLAVRQFTVVEGKHRRRPDVVLFVNGLPLVVVELKKPGVERPLEQGYHQLQTYKAEIPSLFRANALLVVSNGVQARVGSLTAEYGWFRPWRTVDGNNAEPLNDSAHPELSVLVDGLLERSRLLDMLGSFVVFAQMGGKLGKLIAGYHQYHAVNRAVESTLRASREELAVMKVAEDPKEYGLSDVSSQPQGDRKAGVIWHTQGSGKSLLMAFYAGKLIKSQEMRNPTLVVLTDRNDLDAQLFDTFSKCHHLLGGQMPERAGGREDLKERLARVSGGVVFTTLQKFGATEEPLTERANVVVIADEAHRSQYGFRVKMDKETGKLSYGLAKYMRDALPNASFIGFTGTPIERGDANTKQVFGNYVDIYDINRAVEDGATVPIYYESRLARLELDAEEKPKVDREVAELTGDESAQERERLERKWATVEALVGSDKRLAMVAADLVQHLEARLAGMSGKAMAVCMSRRICVRLYEEIVRLRPDWHSEEDSRGKIKVVMTGSASDPREWQRHFGSWVRRRLLVERIRDPEDPLQLVLVCDMLLTGFDAPCLHTMYLDKPLHGYALMQAIARVNRVFGNKGAGLVVDYIGVAQNLQEALAEYTEGDRERVGIKEEEAEKLLEEKFGVVRDMFHGSGVDCEAVGAGSTPEQRLRLLAAAVDWILGQQQARADKEQEEAAKKRQLRRYQDAALALSQAFSLASASDKAREIRDQVGFFLAVRDSILAWESEGNGNGGRRSRRDLDMALQQLVSRAVVSTEIVDILKAAGLKASSISILSDEFLEEVRQMEQKNLALEALQRLLRDGIRSLGQRNLVKERDFTQRLEEAMSRYHTNAMTNAEAIKELLAMARDIRDAHQRGEEQGLSAEELAFYDALAENKSARELMGDDQLRLIAQDLLKGLRKDARVDWVRREKVRASMRRGVKRTLRKYGYPPDLEAAAVQTVLQQAERIAADLAA